MFRHFLTSERLIYEPLDVQTDAGKKLYYEIMEGDMEVRANATSGMLAPAPKSKSDDMMKHVKDNHFNAAVCLKPDNWAETSSVPSNGTIRGTPIGLLSLQATQGSRLHQRSSHMGVAIMSAFQGKGYGTEAVQFMVDWAFLFANLNSVRLETAGDNKASVRCYEKAGFVHEGRLRQHSYWDGQWHDAIQMSVLRDEWQARRDANQHTKET